MGKRCSEQQKKCRKHYKFHSFCEELNSSEQNKNEKHGAPTTTTKIVNPIPWKTRKMFPNNTEKEQKQAKNSRFPGHKQITYAMVWPAEILYSLQKKRLYEKRLQLFSANFQKIRVFLLALSMRSSDCHAQILV